MRSRIDFIQDRIAQNLGESGTCITLVWNVWPPNAVRDPVTNMFTGSPAQERLEVGAFLHFVNATASVRQFNEIQVGDCIVDLAPTVEIRGLDGLIWLLPTGPCGELENWSNKPLSSQLASFWDTLQSGKRLFQTVLLRKST